MVRKIKTIAILLFISTGQIVYAQTNEEKAEEKGIEAVRLMNDGKVDEGIKLLEEAQKLHPERLDYPYELAYAYYLKQDFKEVIKILEKNLNHKEVNERLFQMLGNSYNILGKSDEAFKVYDSGLEKFPKSGTLFLEKGNVHLSKQEYDKAVFFYERGIEVDPKFPSNYYRAAMLYGSSSEKIWSVVYGEIFMNLERGSSRTADISKLLFDIYQSEIKFESDSSKTVGFCQPMTIGDVSDPNNIKLPFCMIYNQTLLMSIVNETSIDINSLDKIRTKFVEIYFKMGLNQSHPNILFEYQNKLQKAGHLEAYNHWILMKGEEEGYNKWQSLNKEKWDSFVKWFVENGIDLSDDNKFYRGQY